MALDWPRYMIAKVLRDGTVSYYWNPHKRDIQGGFPLGRQVLGTDYDLARVKCDGDPHDENDEGLNGFIDAWRAGKGQIKDLDLMPDYGTIDWWFQRYFQSDAFLKKVSDRSKPDYRKALDKIANIQPTSAPPGITTGKLVWHPLEDSQGKLYPEIEAYLAELSKIGTSIVLTPGERGNVRPYSYATPGGL